MNDPALITFDFEDRFPHRMWISTWSDDDLDASAEDAVSIYRYQLVSVLQQERNTVEFLILIQHRDGSKQVLKHYDVDQPDFDRVANAFLEGLAEDETLSFIERDFSDCRTLETFEARGAAWGWNPLDR